MESFWCAARLMSRREAFATHCLGLAGFETYLPRLRERRIVRGRRVDVHPPLFPGYAFIVIALQWHDARWCPGVLSLIMDGTGPARVPERPSPRGRSLACSCPRTTCTRHRSARLLHEHRRQFGPHDCPFPKRHVARQ